LLLKDLVPQKASIAPHAVYNIVEIVNLYFNDERKDSRCGVCDEVRYIPSNAGFSTFQVV